MKKHFQDVEIDCWVERKARLSKCRPCICMSAESNAIAVLLDAVSEIQMETSPSRRTLTLKPQRKDGLSKLQIRLAPKSDGMKILSIKSIDGALLLELTSDAVSELKSALQSWHDGGEDFCICPIGNKQSRELWLWRTMLP